MKLSKAGEVSIKSFLMATTVLSVLVFHYLFRDITNALQIRRNIWFLPAIYSLILVFYLRTKYVGFLYQVAIRSVFLGTIFSYGMIATLLSFVDWNLFGIYVCVMSFFHFSEFVAISLCNPKTLTLGSFLLNHSPQYNCAAVASWIEYAVEMFFFPEIKEYYYISYFGLALCIMGEILRKTAMITGNLSFDHVVQTERKEIHKLVTHGVYSFVRHPSYVGWFYWSIGTQLVLLNPLCIVGYTIASWRFFKDRIHKEEEALLFFFGDDYVSYQSRVRTGLPGIKGFIGDEDDEM